MTSDPRQLLLMHVEKIVLVVMGALLIVVLWFYQPWSVEVRENQKIKDLLTQGLDLRAKKDSPWTPEVPPALDCISGPNGLYPRPWQNDPAPSLLPPNWPIFWNLPKNRVWKAQAPAPPTVVPVTAVYAKADRGQAVIVFQLDDMAQRRALETTGVTDYQNGLEVERVEVWRIDRNTRQKTRITPDGWLPADLPPRYGGPAPTSKAAPADLFGIPVYTYAQGMQPDPRAEDEMRRRMQEEMRKRMEEEMRRRRDEEKKMEERRRKEDEDRLKRELEGSGPRPTPPPRTPRTTTPRTPAPRTPAPRTPTPTPTPGATGGTPGGWYYFVDQSIDPDGRYEYNVVVVCKNPVYPQYKDSPQERVPEFVQSEAVSTPPATEVKVESYKRWYLQGGTRSAQIEKGIFKVRSFIGGRREFSAEEIAGIVAELSGADTKTRKPAPKTVAEPEGTWVEAMFNVLPGEEIGGKASVTVGADRREVDFSTGCFVVSIENDLQVVEDHRTTPVSGKDGVVKNEERINRMVIPKLRVAYMDRKGVLRTKWQEVAPPLTKTADKN